LIFDLKEPFGSENSNDFSDNVLLGKIQFPTSNANLSSTWDEKGLHDAKDLIRGLLNVDWERRLSVPEARVHCWIDSKRESLEQACELWD
jgi:hypothetical protein